MLAAPRSPPSLGNLRYNNVDIVDVQALNRNRLHFAPPYFLFLFRIFLYYVPPAPKSIWPRERRKGGRENIRVA